MNGKQHPLCAILETIEYETPTVQSEQPDIELVEPEQEVWQFDPGICG